MKAGESCKWKEGKLHASGELPESQTLAFDFPSQLQMQLSAGSHLKPASEKGFIHIFACS